MGLPCPCTSEFRILGLNPDVISQKPGLPGLQMLWAFLRKTPWNLALKGKLFHEGPGVGQPPERGGQEDGVLASPWGILESEPIVPGLRLTSWTSPGGDACGCPLGRAPCVPVAGSPAHLPVLAGTLPTPAQSTRHVHTCSLPPLTF